ncbi:sialate O-acetylesterase [Aquimarina sp. ERC-38]|uniref:sialate O-acetylesterase n=1 Tax=Aquimarina sp. ERC-38 TaxID=2949996 RepID=UPI002246282F|nr:sialate O-acetylesterase [Aquimarina sp. ERC-38]UZO82237.1 sialate O-acetylesterase [Aquimarina sp. ERC-38]
MNIRILKIFALLYSFTISLGNAQNEDEVQVVLLAGQSNMVGHGNYDELSASVKDRIEKVASRVLVTDFRNRPKPLSEVDGKQTEKYPFSKHFGPELFMGLTLAEKYPDHQFLMIKTATGGTSLHGAWNPDWSQEKANISEKGEVRKKLQLYAKHIDNSKVHLKRLLTEGKKYKIMGIGWLQGENDAGKPIAANNYKVNLQNLISSYRKEFGIADLPFIIGQINVPPRKYAEGPEQVRTAMLEVAKADKKVAIVTTKPDKPWTDYPKHPDNVHYNAEGQKKLGIAFGEKLINLMD